MAGLLEVSLVDKLLNLIRSLETKLFKKLITLVALYVKAVE